MVRFKTEVLPYSGSQSNTVWYCLFSMLIIQKIIPCTATGITAAKGTERPVTVFVCELLLVTFLQIVKRFSLNSLCQLLRVLEIEYNIF